MKTLFFSAIFVSLLLFGGLFCYEWALFNQCKYDLIINKPEFAKVLLEQLKQKSYFVSEQEIDSLIGYANRYQLLTAIERCGEGQFLKGVEAFMTYQAVYPDTELTPEARTVRNQCLLDYADQQTDNQVALDLALKVYHDNDLLTRDLSITRLAAYSNARYEELLRQGAWFSLHRFLANLEVEISDEPKLNLNTLAKLQLLAQQALAYQGQSGLQPLKVASISGEQNSEIHFINQLLQVVTVVFRGPSDQYFVVNPKQSVDVNLPKGDFLIAMKVGTSRVMLDDFESVPGVEYDYKLFNNAGQNQGMKLPRFELTELDKANPEHYN